MWDREQERSSARPGEPFSPRILVIDDDEVDRLISRRLLTEIFGADLWLEFATHWEAAEEMIAARAHDIYLVDHFLGGRTGLELIESALQDDDTRVFILLTGQESRDVDIAATQVGVADYLIKTDLTASRLERSLRYATESMRQKRMLIEQAIELREAKAAIEEEVKKELALSRNLKETERQLIEALERAEESEHRYRWLSQHDLLTGIPNRSLFAEHLRTGLDQASRSGKHVALFLLDIDRFKAVNDTFGHPIGDGLLNLVAERLSETVRSSDLVARLGGDEFAIIATNLEQEMAASIAAEKIIAALSRPFEIAGHHLETGASIGIALFSGQGYTSPDEMMQRADAALYRAKQAGRSTFQFFDEALNKQIRRAQILKKEMAQAIATEQFSLVFHPKIDLDTGEIAGLEVLTRWTHPRLGPVSPGEFIDVAESTGQIIALSTWIFEQACRTAEAWKGTSMADVPLALNLSALQLKQDGLVEWILGLLDRFSLDPCMLDLEITETAALENLPLAIKQLNKLREAGVRISIDDFGTGFSSLSLATSLPADCLKIDLSFVSGMLENPADAAAVDTTITLARSLGVRTVAEGVETQEQLDYLRERACHEAQGYLFVKPLPAVEILQWVDERRGRFLPAA